MLTWAPAPFRPGDVFGACRVRRTGGNHGRRRAARSHGGGSREVRTGCLFRVTAVAIPFIADDRLLCAGERYPDRGRYRGTRRRPLVFALRGRGDARGYERERAVGAEAVRYCPSSAAGVCG